jgi:hypothetical protein
VTRYLLDTNIIGNFILPVPSPELAAWMERQVDDDLLISTRRWPRPTTALSQRAMKGTSREQG